MRSSRRTPEQQAVVSRRLALLGAEPPTAPVDLLGWAAGPGGLPPDAVGDLARPRPWGEPVLPAEPPSGAAALPVPGRHAARRREERSSEWRLAPLAARVRLGPSQVTVLALLLGVGLALTCWWLLRTEPHSVPPVVPTVGTAPGWPEPSPARLVEDPSAAASPSAEVVVDVAGKVRRPGIVVLEAGARVVDALQAAGGTRPGVDLSSVNLARVLVDGEQILVGTPGGGLAPPTVPGQPVPGAPAALVDLNTADQTQLEALPEVGPVTAQAIIGWREEHGGFTSVDQLLDVDGIGEATLSRIAPLVTL